MGQEMVCLVLCSASTWEESVSIGVGWRVQWMLAWASCWGCCYILLCPPHFLLGGFAVVGRAVLRSLTAFVDVSFSPLASLSLFLHILCSSDVVPIHLGLLCIADVLALTPVLLILINVLHDITSPVCFFQSTCISISEVSLLQASYSSVTLVNLLWQPLYFNWHI